MIQSKQKSLSKTPKPGGEQGPPVERLEQGYQLFSVVCFSRGPLPTKKVGQRALADLPTKRRPSRPQLPSRGGRREAQKAADCLGKSLPRSHTRREPGGLEEVGCPIQPLRIRGLRIPWLGVQSFHPGFPLNLPKGNARNQRMNTSMCQCAEYTAANKTFCKFKNRLGSCIPQFKGLSNVRECVIVRACAHAWVRCVCVRI